jgi:hypothetical protein
MRHDFITMKIYRQTRQNLKILAALRGETSAEVLDKLVTAALKAEEGFQAEIAPWKQAVNERLQNE